MKWTLGAVAITGIAGLLVSGCGDIESDEVGSGDDPFRNVVSDKRAPDVSVTVRDGGGEQVADINYDSSKGRIPSRATYAFLQTHDEGTWSTAYTLSRHLDNGYDEGVPKAVNDDAYGGPGPDTYRLPDLDANGTYRICISFVVGHPATDATDCSTSFHTQ